MSIPNLVGIGLLCLSIITGCAVLGDSAYVVNSVLSPEFAWLLLCASWTGGVLLRIIAVPAQIALTLKVSANALLILGLLSGIVLLLATLGLLDVRNVFSLWGLFGGGVAVGAVCLLLKRHQPWRELPLFAQNQQHNGDVHES
jgi:hypothetical protein